MTALRRVAEAGASNSAFTTEGWSSGSHGFDTVSLEWRDPAAMRDMRTLVYSRACSPETGRRLYWTNRDRCCFLTEPVRGKSLGWLKGGSGVVADGRLAAMVAGGQGDHRLLSTDALADAVGAARDAFASLGVALKGEPVLRRFDLASEIRLPAGEGRDGVPFGLRAWPRARTLDATALQGTGRPTRRRRGVDSRVI